MRDVCKSETELMGVDWRGEGRYMFLARARQLSPRPEKSARARFSLPLLRNIQGHLPPHLQELGNSRRT
jgi:hypothetical protein